MAESTPPEPGTRPRRPRRRFTRRRVLLYAFLFLLGTLEGLFLYFTQPQRIIAMASDALSRMTGAEVQIEHAYFGLDGTIRLYNVCLTVPDVPGAPPGGNQLFTAGQVVIEHNMASLLVGQLDVRSINLIQPTFYPTEDVDHNRFTFQYLKPAKKERRDEEKDRIRNLPEVRLNYALLVFGEIVDGKYRALDTVQLDGDLKRSEGAVGAYSFALREPRGSSPFILAGDFDLSHETMTAQVQFGKIVPNDRRLNLIPRQVRSVIQKLEPTGTLKTISFGLSGDQQFSATIEVADGSVRLLHGDNEVFIKDTHGPITLTNNDQVTIDLKGSIEGKGYAATYEVSGTVQGLDENAAFDVAVHLDGSLPDDIESLKDLPPQVRALLNRYGPQGRFIIDATIQRDPSTSTLLTSGTVQLVDSSLVYSRFPYPLKNVNGVIAFENDRIDIRNLIGFGPPDETGHRAKVTVNGWVIGNGRDPGVTVTVDAEGVPLNDAFFAALRDDERETFNLFFSPKRYAALLNEKNGLVQTSKELAARKETLAAYQKGQHFLAALAGPDDPLRQHLDAEVSRFQSLIERPVFDLGGKANVHVDVFNYPGVRDGDTTIIASGKGINVLYDRWPYPLKVDQGDLIIRIGQNVELVDGLATGLSGGSIAIEGKVEIDPDQGRMEPKLKLTARHAPIDRFLLASIPSTSARWVRDLRLSGNLDADGTIFNDADDETDFRIGIRIAGASAKPNGGGYELEEVTGKLTVHRGGVDIESVQGRRGESILKVSSNDVATTGVAGVTLEGFKMQLGLPLLDLIPADDPARAQLEQLLRTYEPSGEFDFKLSDTKQTDGLLDYRFEIRPRTLDFTLGGQKVSVAEATGWAEVSRKHVVLHDLTGKFPDGQFRIDGSFGGGDGKVDLNFDIESDQLCKVSRVLIPPAAVAVIDALQFAGKYKVTGATLMMDPRGEGEVLSFRAPVQMKDADAVVGVKLTELNGQMEVNVRAKRDESPRVSLKMSDARLRAADRFVDHVTIEVEGTEKAGEYAVRKLKGEIYGGTLTGTGKVWRENRKNLYQMDVAIQEILLEPFLKPLDPKNRDFKAQRVGIRQNENPRDDKSPADASTAPPPGNEKDTIVRPTEGVLSASLSIQGEANNPDEKRGRGEVRIVNADIEQTPVGGAVLHLLNISAPLPQTFRKVDVSYLLEGDIVHFDKVHFETGEAFKTRGPFKTAETAKITDSLPVRVLRWFTPMLSITGSGTMKYSTQELDLRMTSSNPNGLDLGDLSEALKLLRDEFISIEVKGTLMEPKASIRTLPGVRGTVGEVIGKPKVEKP
ncbi:MAG: hypothetical protein WD768_00315 [Phycisphaeraceae bacterium]